MYGNDLLIVPTPVFVLRKGVVSQYTDPDCNTVKLHSRLPREGSCLGSRFLNNFAERFSGFQRNHPKNFYHRRQGGALRQSLRHVFGGNMFFRKSCADSNDFPIPLQEHFCNFFRNQRIFFKTIALFYAGEEYIARRDAKTQRKKGKTLRLCVFARNI